MRHITGHRISMLGIMLVSGAAAFAYSDWLTPAINSPGPLFLTDEGSMLWVYSLLWLLVAVLAVVDFVLGRTTWSVPAFIGILTTWGLAFFGAWVIDGADGDPWKTASLYLGFAAFALGKHLKIAKYEKYMQQANHTLLRTMTGPVKKVGRDE